MEINQALRERIGEIKKLSDGIDKKLLEERFIELFLLVNRVDKDFLDGEIIRDIEKLKEKVVVNSVKHKLKRAEEKERKISKIDDFNELCGLIKYGQFDEAIKKFNERKS